MTLRENLAAALEEAKVIDPMDGTIAYWDMDGPGAPGWSCPDRLLDALERAILGWSATPVEVEGDFEPVGAGPGRHRRDDPSVWLG